MATYSFDDDDIDDFFNWISDQLEQEKPFLTKVGMFITSFANAEAEVHMVARKLSDLPDNKARVIFGGMRLSDVIDRIRKMINLKPPNDELSDVIDCLNQLNIIADPRHKLVHRTTAYANNAIHVSNYLTAKHAETAEEEMFTMGDLELMHIDCMQIAYRLFTFREADDFSPEAVDLLQKVQQMPWLYKPAPPNSQTKKPRNTRKSRQRQPPPSQA